MEGEKELVNEIKKLNEKLDQLTSSGKYMIYSASPAKFSFFNFLAGIFHSLGSLIGYVIIFAVAAVFLSRINLPALVGKWVESTMSQINWGKVISVPGVNN